LQNRRSLISLQGLKVVDGFLISLTLWSTGIPIGKAARMLSAARENVCMTVEMSDRRLIRSNGCFIEVVSPLKHFL
jgi:hypothetical protein